MNILEKIASKTNLRIDYSGGIKSDEISQAVFERGAAMAAIGSVAVKNKPMFVNWLSKYGANKILLGVDVRNEKLAVSGWMEQTAIGIFSFLQEMVKEGVTQMFCTDIGKDGMMSGPSVDLYKKIKERYPQIELIASGGVSSPEQLNVLSKVGCSSVIVGKAIYEDFEGLDKWN